MRGCWRTSGLCPRMKLPVGEGVEPLICQTGGWELGDTVLGLIPFLTDGPSEVLWFDFAAGTISGMLFSVLAVVFVLPVFLPFED